MFDFFHRSQDYQRRVCWRTESFHHDRKLLICRAVLLFAQHLRCLLSGVGRQPAGAELARWRSWRARVLVRESSRGGKTSRSARPPTMCVLMHAHHKSAGRGSMQNAVDFVLPTTYRRWISSGPAPGYAGFVLLPAAAMTLEGLQTEGRGLPMPACGPARVMRPCERTGRRGSAPRVFRASSGLRPAAAAILTSTRTANFCVFFFYRSTRLRRRT